MLSWKVPYALDRPLTSLPPGMLMSTSYTKPRIHRSSHGTPGTAHTLPGTSTLLLMVAIANSRWPNTWASNPAPYKSALRQNQACRPWQSEHERAPLGWISRGSTYAHCACAGQPPLTHTLDRRLISVTPHSSPFSPEAVEPMLSWSPHKKEVGLRHRSPSGAPPRISSTESLQCRSALPFLLSYSKLKT